MLGAWKHYEFKNCKFRDLGIKLTYTHDKKFLNSLITSYVNLEPFNCDRLSNNFFDIKCKSWIFKILIIVLPHLVQHEILLRQLRPFLFGDNFEKNDRKGRLLKWLFSSSERWWRKRSSDQAGSSHWRFRSLHRNSQRLWSSQQGSGQPVLRLYGNNLKKIGKSLRLSHIR